MSEESIGTGATPDEQDQQLITAVAGMLDRVDPPPGWMVDLAKLSFDLRSIDAELAELVADSRIDEPLVAVRSAGTVAEPRLLTFESSELAVELEVDRDERGRPALTGQLVPGEAAEVELRQPGAQTRSVQTDDLGRFRFDDLADGPFSLVCRPGAGRPVASPWVTPE